MKHIIILLILFFGVSSCSNQHEPITLIPEKLYSVADGTIISGIDFFCMPFKKESYRDLGFSGVKDYENSTKTVSSYYDFFFILEIRQDNQTYHFSDKDKEKILQSELNSYLHSKGDVLRENLNYHANIGDEFGYGLDQFFTAYVDGEVEISCDKTLFGLSPGTNITKYLKIIYNYTCQPCGAVEPYSIIHCEDIEKSLKNSVFSDEAWVRFKYCFCFNEKPEEDYEDLTFHIKFPIIKESASLYFSSLIKGNINYQQFEKEIYESETKIQFK